MYHTVLFDLDGTLLNTIQDLADAANWVCAQNGWPQHTLEEYKRFVGNGIPKLCERFTPPQARGPQQLAHTLVAFEARYGLHKQDATAPYPGISDLLNHLSSAGICFGVLTNKEHRLAQAVMEYYFPGVFSFVQGAVPGVPPKPDPAGAKALMARMGAVPQTTLFVGDSDVDVSPPTMRAWLPAGCCGGSAAKRSYRMREPSTWLPAPPNCWILSLHKKRKGCPSARFPRAMPKKENQTGVRFGSLFLVTRPGIEPGLPP